MTSFGQCDFHPMDGDDSIAPNQLKKAKPRKPVKGIGAQQLVSQQVPQ